MQIAKLGSEVWLRWSRRWWWRSARARCRRATGGAGRRAPRATSPRTSAAPRPPAGPAPSRGTVCPRLPPTALPRPRPDTAALTYRAAYELYDCYLCSVRRRVRPPRAPHANWPNRVAFDCFCTARYPMRTMAPLRAELDNETEFIFIEAVTNSIVGITRRIISRVLSHQAAVLSVRHLPFTDSDLLASTVTYLSHLAQRRLTQWGIWPSQIASRAQICQILLNMMTVLVYSYLPYA